MINPTAPVVTRTHGLAPLLLCCLAVLVQPVRAAGPTPDSSSTPAAIPIMLETVQVNAGAESAQDERQHASTAKIVIDRAELEKMDAATVGEILRRLPGVSLSTDTGGRRHGRGRGAAADRLEPKIVVDGEALPGGNRNAITLPVELIERIEILKTSTAEFPSGPGGTINLILRDVIPNKVGTWRTGITYDGQDFGGRAGVTYGDREGQAGVIGIGFADTRPSNGSRTVTREQFSGGVRNDFDVEHDEDSGRDNGLHLISRFTRDLGDGERLVLSPFLFGRSSDSASDTRRLTYADPGNATGLMADGRERNSESGQRVNGRVSLDWKKRQPGKGEMSVQAALQSGIERSDRTRDDYDAANVLQTRTETEDTSSNLGFSLKGKRSLPLADTHVGSFGVEARYRTTDDERSERVNGVVSALGAQAGAESRDREIALWGQDEWQVAAGHLLTPGLRVQVGDRRTEDATGLVIADAQTDWLPSLAYLWQFHPKWNFRTSAALSSRAPGVSQLSPVVRTTDGLNTLANPDRAGNPALTPETTATLQFGIEHFLPEQRGSAGINVFLREIDDKIQNRTLLEAGRYVERPFNVASASETSIVADFKWKFAGLPALTVRGNVSTSRLKLEDAGAAFVRQESPRRAANLGADYEWQSRQISLGGTLSYSSDFTREANPETQQFQLARTQVDVYLSKKLGKTVTLKLNIDNLTREGRGDDSLEYMGGVLSQREIDRAEGIRVVSVSLEGKF